MSLEGAAVSLGATIVSVAFAALVFNQWIARRKPYQLAWSFGLGLYGAAAFLQFLAEAYGWSVQRTRCTISSPPSSSPSWGVVRRSSCTAAPGSALLSTPSWCSSDSQSPSPEQR